MVKVIRIPDEMELSHNGSVWKLLSSKAFSRLRCGFLEDELTKDQLIFLKKEFAKYCVLTDSPLAGEEYVDESDELSFIMMKKAAYILTKKRSLTLMAYPRASRGGFFNLFDEID